MCFEVPLLFDKLFGFFFTIVMFFNACKVHESFFNQESIEHFVEQTFEVIFMPYRTIFPCSIKNTLDLPFEVLAVDQKDRSH